MRKVDEGSVGWRRKGRGNEQKSLSLTRAFNRVSSKEEGVCICMGKGAGNIPFWRLPTPALSPYPEGCSNDNSFLSVTALGWLRRLLSHDRGGLRFFRFLRPVL